MLVGCSLITLALLITGQGARARWDSRRAGVGEGEEGSQRVPAPRSSPSAALPVPAGVAKHVFKGRVLQAHSDFVNPLQQG